ncbi:hypothetical protein I907_gp45 [Bacillus phage Eoghan]|uniref:Uncharacterized protein n=2 Tax=Andromedavirus TaxID=1623275 RepID=M1HN47_9CAUD|nr:hypothetical protein I907_gp45 [Bacillus phage Eoghan]YP_009592278.1 hypothetical protein FDG68_gp45 [Bacillus phage Taylor]AGE60809.1 hypothetical protein EOGHAN_46 [Bacillus phage Eoghan]AGE60963.1 hypothetical protein TAYLOR_45 [Bacillus phage Taylor]
MSRFPHLEKHDGGNYLSSIVTDKYDVASEMQYCVSSVDELVSLEIDQDDGLSGVFYLEKEHLPFLKQLVKDLEEATK